MSINYINCDISPVETPARNISRHIKEELDGIHYLRYTI